MFSAPRMYLYCGFMLVSVWGAARAADSADVAVELDRMVVTGRRSTAAAYNRLDSATISRPRDSRTIDGLLTGLAGVDVKRSSPSAGKGRGVTLRGFDESRFLILLDGRPLNGSGVMGGHYVDWASLSTDNIEAIEVIRGPRSAEFGNTFGGAVNIITKGPLQAGEKTSVSASYGVFAPEEPEDIRDNGTFDLSLTHRARIGDRASLDLYASRGHGEPFLRNNYYTMTNTGGNLSVVLPGDVTVDAGVRNAVQRRGFAIANHRGDRWYDPAFPESDESAGGGPGIKWNTNPSRGGADSLYFGDRSFWRNIRTQTDVSVEKKFGGLALRARAYINDQNRTEYFYAITDTNKLVLERFTEPEDHTWGWKLKAEQALAEQYSFNYGFEGISLRYGNADIRHIDTAYFAVRPSDGPDETIRASDRYSVWFQSTLSLLDRLELTPGVRYDYYLGNKRDSTVDATPLHGVGPNAGAVVRTWKGADISLNGAWRYRFPTCPELYWYYNGHSFDGRKDFSPERAVQLEGGISQRLRPGKRSEAEIAVRGYHYIVEDYIRTVFGGRPVPPLKPKASRLIYNIDRVTFTGMEIEGTATLFDRFDVWANYTYQTTRKEGDVYDSSTTFSEGLPELPRHKANAGVEYSWADGPSAGLSMRLVGAREVIRESFTAAGAAYEEIDGFTTFRLFGAWPVYRSDALTAEIKLGVDNLFDVEYEEEPGIPMPGITTTGGVRVTF